MPIRTLPPFVFIDNGVQATPGLTEPMCPTLFVVSYPIITPGIQPNINNSISSFKDLRYILNKIEINLEIQNEISKIEKKEFDNADYIAILKNKHRIYLEYGFKKWPMLTGLRKFKKLFTA